MSGSTVMKNGKTYTKVSAYPFVYRDEDGYFAYRLYNRFPPIDTFATKDPVTGEKFTSAVKAYEHRQERLKKLMEKCPEKAEDNTVDMIWNRICNSISTFISSLKKRPSPLFPSICQKTSLSR